MFTNMIGASTALLLASATLINAQTLPTVDLSYALHQAIDYNSTGKFYTFSNIRYAAPPVGKLRFKAPVAPSTNRTLTNGSDKNGACPSGLPNWLSAAYPFIGAYLGGQRNFTRDSFNVPPAGGPSNPSDAGTPEDCLFLDVVTPKAIFDKANTTGNTGAPVLVWIYGGGYTFGSKTQYGSPAGLISRSQGKGDAGVVYVAMNYRIGAFGWLSGPTFQGDGGIANAGLYDQRLALKWVQDNIAKFGGDPKRVTVFGESAGAGSIMHQITAFGGRSDIQFQNAVLQSPAFAPILSNHQQEAFYNDFLRLAGVSNFAQLQALPYGRLQSANLQQIQNSSYGTFTFGPVVDGVIAPQSPGQLLSKGQFYKNVKVMTGHNSNEGILFTPYYINNDEVFRSELIKLLPNLGAFPDTVDYIMNTMYPADYSGKQGYTDIIGRVIKAISEGIFNCNTVYLAKAFGNQTYSYEFAIPPGIHGNDISSTFYNGNDVPSVPVALAMQQYIASFALKAGSPNYFLGKPNAPWFPVYGRNSSVQILNSTSFKQANDPYNNYRCTYWQKALFE